MGSPSILATGADSRVAHRVSQRFRIFSKIIASDGDANVTGSAKARMLVELFGTGGFVYAGNSTADLKVWERRGSDCDRDYKTSHEGQ